MTFNLIAFLWPNPLLPFQIYMWHPLPFHLVRGRGARGEFAWRRDLLHRMSISSVRFGIVENSSLLGDDDITCYAK